MVDILGTGTGGTMSSGGSIAGDSPDLNSPSVGKPGLGTTIYEVGNYSGSQVLVMMGDVLIDEVVGISFQVSQNKVPVYGYASQYYTFLADGQVSVSGNLTIAFKEAGYLLYPMKRYNETLGVGRSPRYDKEFDPTTGNQIVKSGDLRSLSGAAAGEDKRVITANVEQMFAAKRGEEKGQSTAEGAQRSYNNEVRKLAALPDDDFEDYAEVFEDVLWYGSDRANQVARDKMFSRNLPEGELFDENQVLSHRRPDQYPPIDIWIIYGDPNHPKSNHTVRKLLDLSFTGQVQTIESGPDPVYEMYSFFARTLV